MNPDPVVSVDWLAQHLHDPGLAILDATLPPLGVKPPPDMRSRFLASHIPGAAFFDIEAFSDPASGLPHTLPAPGPFAAQMGALGFSDTQTFVVYEQLPVFSAPRAWWMLRTMGVQRVFLLNGGLPAWVGAGLPTADEAPPRPPAVFVPHFDPDAVQYLPELQQQLSRHAADGAGEQILDARSAERFTGTAPEPRPGLRSGHIPGSLSLPYPELTEAGQLLVPSAARAVFERHGVDLHRPVTTTCGSGVTAAVLALQLHRVGAPGVRLYDGSWAEYGQQPDTPIAHGPATMP